MRPVASIAETRAIGNPVALEASAEERDVLGLISMIMSRSVFDQVFVAGGQEKNPFFKQFRYICATRALHELYVYESE